MKGTLPKFKVCKFCVQNRWKKACSTYVRILTQFAALKVTVLFVWKYLVLSLLIPQQFGTKETEDESHNGSADDGGKKASSVFLHFLIQYFAGICEIHFFSSYIFKLFICEIHCFRIFTILTWHALLSHLIFCIYLQIHTQYNYTELLNLERFGDILGKS